MPADVRGRAGFLDDIARVVEQDVRAEDRLDRIQQDRVGCDLPRRAQHRVHLVFVVQLAVPGFGLLHDRAVGLRLVLAEQPQRGDVAIAVVDVSDFVRLHARILPISRHSQRSGPGSFSHRDAVAFFR